MKQKLWKSRKQRSLSKVVLYTNENGANGRCSQNECTNTVGGCGWKEGVNFGCNPPKSTQPGARNNRCNLVANC